MSATGILCALRAESTLNAVPARGGAAPRAMKKESGDP